MRCPGLGPTPCWSLRPRSATPAPRHRCQGRGHQGAVAPVGAISEPRRAASPRSPRGRKPRTRHARGSTGHSAPSAVQVVPTCHADRVGRPLRSPAIGASAGRPATCAIPVLRGQAESSTRPLRRRAARIARPARVRMRNRKPWVLARRRLFGWNVRLLTTSPSSQFRVPCVADCSRPPYVPQSDGRRQAVSNDAVVGLQPDEARPGERAAWIGRRRRLAQATDGGAPGSTRIAGRHTGGHACPDRQSCGKYEKVVSVPR